MVQQMVREFAQKESPIIKDMTASKRWPFHLPRMGELGILGICFPVRYGGQAWIISPWGLACEELERSIALYG